LALCLDPEFGDVGRVVLAVAIEGRDPWRARRLDAAQDRHALAAAPAMSNRAQPLEIASKASEFRRSLVVAAVIHVDNFIIPGHPRQDPGEIVMQPPNFRRQRRQIGRLVAHGYHHGKVHLLAASMLQPCSREQPV
jgi:hypothetical protein